MLGRGGRVGEWRSGGWVDQGKLPTGSIVQGSSVMEMLKGVGRGVGKEVAGRGLGGGGRGRAGCRLAA